MPTHRRIKDTCDQRDAQSQSGLGLATRDGNQRRSQEFSSHVH
ncbi:hypothetical protein RRG08_055329 [Elysia crispata]|uniref:Uncharacterized protein n=1 Tax=Elysia crispata TaxID=231223 RepID=A0AAE1E2Y9_9GAST|nr:hypothetical protein RRG08_055329 [Elysia crispata]